MEPGREKSKHDDSSRQSRDKDSSKVDADTKDSSTKDKSSSSKSSRKRSSSSHRKKSPRPSEASDDPLENQHERPLMPDGRAGNNCLMSDNLEAEKNELKVSNYGIYLVILADLTFTRSWCMYLKFYSCSINNGTITSYNKFCQTKL